MEIKRAPFGELFYDERVLKIDRPSARGLWYRLWTRPNGREGSKGSEGSACLRQAGSKGSGIALRAMSFIIPLRGMENRTTAPSARGNAPLLVLTHHFPRRGKSALRSALGIISTSMHSTAKSSPSGGKVVPKVPKGVHFQRPQGGCTVFAAKGSIYTHRRQSIPQPSATQPLSNLRTLRPKAGQSLEPFAPEGR